MVYPAHNFGETACFLLARHCLLERTTALLQRKPTLGALQTAVQRGGLKVLFLLKLTPAPPFWEALLFASVRVDFFDFALVFYSVNLLRVPILCWISASAGDLLTATSGEGGASGMGSALAWLGVIAGVLSLVFLTVCTRRELARLTLHHHSPLPLDESMERIDVRRSPRWSPRQSPVDPNGSTEVASPQELRVECLRLQLEAAREEAAAAVDPELEVDPLTSADKHQEWLEWFRGAQEKDQQVHDSLRSDLEAAVILDLDAAAAAEESPPSHAELEEQLAMLATRDTRLADAFSSSPYKVVRSRPSSPLAMTTPEHKKTEHDRFDAGRSIEIDGRSIEVGGLEEEVEAGKRRKKSWAEHQKGLM